MPDETEVHKEALERFDRIIEATRKDRKQALQDRRFYAIAGAQWEGDLGRQFRNKPKLEFNKIQRSIQKIAGEYRLNRISVDFQSGDGTDTDLSELCDGLFRASEDDSDAQEAYDNAFDEAVGGGMGCVRLFTAYEDDEDPENEQLRVIIEPVYEAESTVYFDLNAKRFDKSDARYAFLLHTMTPEEYERKYNDSPETWAETISSDRLFDWSAPNIVHVAEYYVTEEDTKTVFVYESPLGSEVRHLDDEFKSDPDLKKALRATGHRKIREKPIKHRRVRKYVLSGGSILEDLGHITGPHIPLAPMYGKRAFVENVERFCGHVRFGKDPQRLTNMMVSKLAELAAEESREKPIFTKEQIAGNEEDWRTDNVERKPFLTVNPVRDAEGNEQARGPVGFTKAASVPPTLAAIIQISDGFLQDIMGDTGPDEEVRANMSAKLRALIDRKLSMPAYVFIDNFAKMLRRVGEIWFGMAREIYIEPGRKVRVIDRNQNPQMVEVQAPVIDEDSGTVRRANDLSSSKARVRVDVGPASDAIRQSMVDTLKETIRNTSDPQIQRILTLYIIKNLEGEDIGELRDYVQMELVRAGVIKPDVEQGEQMQKELENAIPDPQTEFLQAATEAEKAKATEREADTELTLARTEETRAKTLETLAGIDQKEVEAAVKLSGSQSPQPTIERQ